MSRELRTRARARIQPDTDDESDDADDDESPAQIPASSIQDLVNPADAQQFDQTFTDADAALDIEGAFDPTAGDKQVIPRIAFVLNFNLVYNEQQERWEPDTGNESSSTDVAVSVLEKTANQSLTPIGSFQQITYQQAGVDTLGGANVGSNQIDINADGVYRLAVHQTFAKHDEAADFDINIEQNGTRVVDTEGQGSERGGNAGESFGASKPVALSAGDSITVSIRATKTAAADALGGAPRSFMYVEQLS